MHRSTCARIALCLFLSGCSSVAQAPSYRACERDEDCYPHERCDITQQGRCVSAQIPRRSSFALAGVTKQNPAQGGYEIPWEFKGCELDAFDLETGVARIDLEKKLVPIRLEQLTFNEPIEGLCAASCAPHAYCDATKGQCAFVRHGHWRLRRASRLGLAPLELNLHRAHQSPQPGSSAPAFTFRWPCASAPTWLHEGSQGLGFELGTPQQSPSDRTVTLPGIPCQAQVPGPYRFDLSQQTQDAFKLQVLPLRLGASDSAERFDLSLHWSNEQSAVIPARTRRGIAPRSRACTTDQDCNPTPEFPAYCDAQGQCRLRVPAPRAASLSALGTAPKTALLHRDRSNLGADLIAKIQGGQKATVPTLQLPIELGQSSIAKICVPTWQPLSPSSTLKLESPQGPIEWFSHPPGPLLSGKLACHARDLSVEQDPSNCASPQSPTVTLFTTLNAAGQAAFDAKGCPLPEASRQAMSLPLPLDCDVRGHCQAQARESQFAGPCYDLEVELERPAGELHRSVRQRFEAGLCRGQAPEPLLIQDPWELRPLLRGQVHSAQDSKAPLRVRVMAERLRDDDADPVGPFFFHQDVVPEGPLRGQFALPVEPGRYVLTAVAHDPVKQGLAPFRIVDLRDSAPGVHDPNTQLDLLGGPLVQIQVKVPSDAQNVRARPIDTGSWIEDPEIPDLNDPQTCYPPHRGCLIRMLSIPIGQRGQEIPTDYRSVLRWATRPGGLHECPSSPKAPKEPA